MRQSRLRVFAGPNGSGKSTLVRRLESDRVPLYTVINPDEIEIGLNSADGVDLSSYGVMCTRAHFDQYVRKTSYANTARSSAKAIHLDGQRLRSTAKKASYDAALVAGFIRAELLAARASFSFESVFSHTSKLDELRTARAAGYRIYLYFVAMEDPELCIGRVRERVRLGGHPVPAEKIAKRYSLALRNLVPALKLAYRAYIFDNSGGEATILAERTPAGDLNIKRKQLPVWFDKNVLARL